MSKFDNQFLQSIQRIKDEIESDIELDNAISADPYSNIGRLKTVQKIERIYLKLNGGNDGDHRNNHRDIRPR